MLNFFDPPAQAQDSAHLRPVQAGLGAGLGLDSGNFHDRWDAAKQLAGLGEQALVDLLALVQNDSLDWEIRWFAARSLGNFDRPEVMAVLVNLLCTSADDDLRQAAVEALIQIGPSAIGPLADLLPHSTHSFDAVYTLAQIHHPDTMAPLLHAVSWTQGQLKAAVVEALGQFAKPALQPIIAQALSDVSKPVRLAALRGWVNLQKQLSPDQWLAALEPCLWDVDLDVAQQATYALGRSAEPAATEALLRLLRATSSPPQLKIAAVQALGWQASQAALAGLIQSWPQADQDLRLAIVQSLSRLHGQALATAVTQQFLLWLDATPATPANSLLRRNLVTALGQMGGQEARPLLTTLLTDADDGVRLHAEAALRWLAPA